MTENQPTPHSPQTVPGETAGAMPDRYVYITAPDESATKRKPLPKVTLPGFRTKRNGKGPRHTKPKKKR